MINGWIGYFNGILRFFIDRSLSTLHGLTYDHI